MNYFIKLPLEERLVYFNEASNIQGAMSPKVIEKDFWVCWILKTLFSISEIKDHIIFKGGTSLSKAHNGLIERFSEDIDLTISKEYLGIKHDDLPQYNTSRKVRQEFRKKLDKNCIKILEEKILPLLQDAISNTLGSDVWDIKITNDSNNPTISFVYPRSVNYEIAWGKENIGTSLGYIKPEIKLEFGARGDIFPIKISNFTPYIVQILPSVFNDNLTDYYVTVFALDAERTFWEKIIILHELYYKDPDKALKNSTARHYYDIVMLKKKGIAEKAIGAKQIKEAAIANSRLNCTSSNDSDEYKFYDKLLQGEISIVPSDQHIKYLEKDYINMLNSGMFYGETLKFKEIISQLKELEVVLNKGQ